MKTQFMLRPTMKLKIFTFLLATLLLSGCSDDPKPVNEEELITTLRLTLVPQGGGATVILEFKDLDGDGSGAPEYTYTPSTGTGPNTAALLTANITYTATLELLNETESPAENITEEIEEEADEHLLCFTETVNGLTITYADTEADYLTGGSTKVVGLVTTWETTMVGDGTVTITLRHQPGTKTGACPGSGDTDIEVTFKVSIQ
jgi:hypothetical protein